jgi:hypothetical protein
MSPRGWALANMWYDTMSDRPPPGSPLETLLTLVLVGRKNADLRAIRALVQSTLPAGKEGDPAIKAFKDYHDNLLPFLSRAEDLEKEEARKRLEEFVKGHAIIDKTTLLQQQMAQEHTRARIRASALKPKTEATLDRRAPLQNAKLASGRVQHPDRQRPVPPRSSSR